MSDSFDGLKLSLPIELNAFAVWADARRTVTALGVLHLGVASTYHPNPAHRKRFDALKFIWAFNRVVIAESPDVDRISGVPIRCP